MRKDNKENGEMEEDFSISVIPNLFVMEEPLKTILESQGTSIPILTRGWVLLYSDRDLLTTLSPARRDSAISTVEAGWDWPTRVLVDYQELTQKWAPNVQWNTTPIGAPFEANYSPQWSIPSQKSCMCNDPSKKWMCTCSL